MECFCGYDVSMQSRWTVQNSGRRFAACPDYDVHDNTRSFSFGWQTHDWMAQGGHITPYGGKNKASKGSYNF